MMAAKRKQWTFEDTRNLIQIYKMHENLWNPESINYKNREKRFDSLRKIASTFRTSVQEVARKIKNINSQYHRERRNEEIRKSTTGRIYRAKWFGYAAMSFLHDTKMRKTGQNGLESEGTDLSSDCAEVYTVPKIEIEDFEIEEENSASKLHSYADEDAEIQEETETTNIEQEEIEYNRTNDLTLENRTQTNEFLPPNSCTNTLKPKETNRMSEEALAVMETVLQNKNQERERDEFQVYGEYVAHKIRNLRTEYSRATAQHLINNIIYDAQIGKYDFPPQVQAPVVPVVIASAAPSFDHQNH